MRSVTLNLSQDGLLDGPFVLVFFMLPMPLLQRACSLRKYIQPYIVSIRFLKLT